MRNLACLGIFVILVGSFSAQAQKTGTATASGVCSIAISGNDNTLPSAALQANYCGLSTVQMMKIVSLLNTLFTKRDANQINAKLDELIALARKEGQQTVVNAPVTQSNIGGCNQQVVGGNGNTTNCAPPPMKMSDAKLEDFKNAMQKVPARRLIVMLATNNQDSASLSWQICDVVENLNWAHTCPNGLVPNLTDPNGRPTVVEGLQCYANNWNDPAALSFVAAMRAGGLDCSYNSPLPPIAMNLLVTMGWGPDGQVSADPGMDKIAVVVGAPK